MLPENYKALTDNESLNKIAAAKKKLGDKIFILAHHYQRDEIVKYADATGDSLKLSKIAASANAKYIIFCGVHFMAETADIINEGKKIVILPDINAGCPMADMARLEDVEKIWEIIKNKDLIPITYINSTADIKAFCGENNGYVCTSSNAEAILKYLFNKRKKILFMPDKNLGLNTAKKIGIAKKEICLLENNRINKNARLFLWDGCCPVHIRFSPQAIDDLRKKTPDIKVIVHPEVPEKVAAKADFVGSTEFIVNTIESAEKGSKWAIGTEIHLVNRLAKNNPDKEIQVLSTPLCMCSMMDRTSPQHLAHVLDSLLKGNIINRVQVPHATAKKALSAINRMLKIN